MTNDNKLDRLLELITEQRVDIAAMKVDLSHHIKRSDAHEEQLKQQAEKIGNQNDKISKLWYAVVGLAGAGIGNVGPNILKYLGDLL